MSFEAKNLIGRHAVAGCKGSIQAVNPATNELLDPVYHGVSDADFEKALSLAWDAFLQYRQTSNEARAFFLESIAAEIEAVQAEIVARAMLETALPQPRLEGECTRTCNQLRLFADVLRKGAYRGVRVDKALPDRKPLPRADIRYHKIALGPVAVFGASNFPLAFSVAGGDTASALAAGCSVVVKAHNAHPGTSELVGGAVQRAVAKCSMPEGVFALLYGEGNEIGQKLVAHPYIKAVGFTGSRAGGLALSKIIQTRPEPVPLYAEMSSINPVYLMPDAMASQGSEIGAALAAAMAMGAGQFCTSPGLVFAVDGKGFEAFVESSAAAVAAQPAQVMLTAEIAAAFEQGVANLSAIVELLAAGEISALPNRCRAHLFMVDGDTLARQPSLMQEIFGSCAVIVRCNDFAQLQMLTDELEGQLTAAIFATGNDNQTATLSLLRQLERKAGRIIFNGFGTGVEVCDAMVHGGPFPATSDSRTTSVGATAIDRFLRPVCYQDVPVGFL